jgi:tetratricopeptide (TPR) repeat protein
LGGNPLSLTLAANLLIAEEQIPQIRYLVRYGKIFDLNQPQGLQPIPIQAVFDRSFKRLPPKLRNLLIIASIYAQPFNLLDLQGMQTEENLGEVDLADLQKLEKFGLIRSLGQNYFCCDRQIKALIPLPDPKPFHEQAIQYYWTQTKPYFDWESDRDLAPYLAIFHHCCALEEFYRAFYIIRDDSEQCLDPYLEAHGKHFLRISLFKPLLAAWQGIQSERSEFGAVLIGLGDAYSAIHRYDRAVPLYQIWLRILVKRHDPLERQAKAQCLYKLAITLFTQASVPPLSILPYFQESLEIAIKSSDRPLELNNLLGLGNLYSRTKEYPQALEYYDRHLNLAREVQNLEAQIDCLPMMATAYQAIKQYDKALELYRTHLTLIPDYGFDRAARADSLENVAQIYQILGDYPQAKVNYQDCLDLVITNGIENASQRGNCLFGIGISSDRLGQFKEAITYYQQALEIFKDSHHEPDCLINLANAHTSLGLYKEAVGFYEQALKLSLQVSNISWQAQALIGLGNVQNSLGKFVKAIQFYEQAWEISKNLKAQKAIALSSLGHVYNAIGQYQEAMDLYKRSLAIAKEIGDKSQQALCLNSLGQVLDRLGYYAQALQFYQEWIDLKKAMGDRTATLTTLNRNRSSNLTGGLAHSKYAQAIEFHQQWIEVKRKMGDRQGEANSLGNLGNAFFALGQYPQAIQSYQQCLEMARTISDRRSEASSLSGLGSAFFVLGQYTQAIEFHSRSLEISQKIDDPIIQAQTFSNLGKAYYALGQYLQAAQKYQQCLEIIRKIGNRQGEANVLGDLGNVHYALGKYSQANDFYLQWLEISTEIGDRSQEGNALGGLGNGHNAIGQYSKAVEFYSQWLEIAQEISDRRSQANALAGLGNAYNALGEYSRAIEFHQQSLKIQKENSDRHTEKTTWYKFADTLENLEQKSLSPNPYTAIDVESIDQDDSAIQQLLEAGSTAILSREIKSNITRKSAILKSKPTSPKHQTPKQNWLGSTFGWLTGKKQKRR